MRETTELSTKILVCRAACSAATKRSPYLQQHFKSHSSPQTLSLLWVLRVHKPPGTYENILGGKDGVCMFLSLSSPPEGSARNPEQLQKFVWEKGGDVREVGTYSGKEHPQHSPPTYSFKCTLQPTKRRRIGKVRHRFTHTCCCIHFITIVTLLCVFCV